MHKTGSITIFCHRNFDGAEPCQDSGERILLFTMEMGYCRAGMVERAVRQNRKMIAGLTEI
jgi:hypothetical protein